MKKIFAKCLPLALLVLALCMTSIAVSADTAVISGAAYENGTVSLDVAAPGEQIVIIALDGAKDVPYLTNNTGLEAVAGDLIYLDQAANNDGASFSFLPGMADEESITVYASSTDATGVVAETIPLVAPAAQYTVSYDLAGGVAGTGEYFEIYTEGDETALPAPTKIGYTFEGWYDGSALITSVAGKAANLELTARWTEVIATDGFGATVDANEGDVYGSYGGVYTDGEDTFGVLSVTAKVAQYASVEKYGFVIYGNKTLEIQPVAGELDADGFYTVVYNIPEDKFNQTLIFKPYVVIGTEYYYGEAVSCKVNDFDTETPLGTAEELGFN